MTKRECGNPKHFEGMLMCITREEDEFFVELHEKVSFEGLYDELATLVSLIDGISSYIAQFEEQKRCLKNAAEKDVTTSSKKLAPNSNTCEPGVGKNRCVQRRRVRF